MADTDQAQGDSGGSWWDGVTGAAGSAWDAAKEVASKIPSGLDAAEKMGSETAKKVTEGLGEATGLGSKLASSALGAIPGIVNGISDSSKASDARLDGMLHEDDKDRVAFDNEKDAYYGGKVEADAVSAVAGAIPGVGLAYDAAEVGAGVWNAVTGGEGGYKGGTESFENHVADVCDMATANWKGITGGSSDTHVADAGWGAREALQKKYEADAAARGAEP